jgi:hypothetical protein
MNSRPSTAASILAVLAIVLALMGAYVGGYFWLGEWGESNVPYGGARPYEYRSYRQRWQAIVFAPAGQLESWMRGIKVEVTSAIP